MKVEEAREVNGKIVATVYTDCYAMLDGGGRLCWWYKETHELHKPVCLAAILGDYWLPYHEEKEIRPEKAGELWDSGKEKYITFSNGRNDLRMFGQSGGEYVFEEFFCSPIHDKGWTRLYPPVEDESVERIEIEGVEWATAMNINGNTFAPSTSRHWPFPFKDLVTKPQMKMILEIPRKK
jgi:hypothetical protein